MFQRVISRVPQSSTIVKSMQISTTVESPKIEKTINQVTLLGRVGVDPQQRGNSEHPIVIFSVATHSNYKYTNGDFVQRTEWHKVCVFKPSLRESILSYLKKGQRVLISGKLSYGEYKDEDGNAKPSTTVIADDVIYFQNS